MKPQSPLLSASVLAFALLFVGGSVPAHAAIDPFYAELLRDGIHAYNAANYVEAARDLRLACFGMLEDPDPLVDCLARLSLAQDKAGDLDGFRDTFRRISEVEERFGSYGRASLPADVRSAFEQRATALIPKATLETLPAFRSLAARAAAPPAATGKPHKGKPEREASSPIMSPAAPPTQVPQTPAAAQGSAAAGPTAGPTAAPNSSAGSAGSAGRTTAPPSAVPPAATPPAPAASSARPSASAPLTDAEKGKMGTARRLLGEEGKAKDLREAFQLAREVADAHPESSEAQHLAAEAAYRISRWGDAATYFRRGGDPGEKQPELLFYMAVSLYESGDATGAAAALRRSLPNLQRTPYVDGYARKILGT
jgi:hypothetical protein